MLQTRSFLQWNLFRALILTPKHPKRLDRMYDKHGVGCIVIRDASGEEMTSLKQRSFAYRFAGAFVNMYISNPEVAMLMGTC